MSGIEEEFICGFCLSTTESDHGPPKSCPHCHVARCIKCYSWVKEDAHFCYGCGTLFPELSAKMVGTYQTASVYTVEDWTRRNRSRDSDAKYSICSGVHPKTMQPGKWISRGENSEFVRDLTLEEIEQLNLSDRW